jgi:hypothetical protein
MRPVLVFIFTYVVNGTRVRMAQFLAISPVKHTHVVCFDYEYVPFLSIAESCS